MLVTADSKWVSLFCRSNGSLMPGRGQLMVPALDFGGQFERHSAEGVFF
jgi:hypothetical protein